MFCFYYAPVLSDPRRDSAYDFIEVEELLPGILMQLGPDALSKLQESLKSQGGSFPGAGDEDVPDLVENFDQPKGTGAAAAAKDDDIPELVDAPTK